MKHWQCSLRDLHLTPLVALRHSLEQTEDLKKTSFAQSLHPAPLVTLIESVRIMKRQILLSDFLCMVELTNLSAGLPR